MFMLFRAISIHCTSYILGDILSVLHKNKPLATTQRDTAEVEGIIQDPWLYYEWLGGKELIYRPLH